MNLGISTELAPVDAQKQTVLRQVKCDFNADGTIKFQGTVCDRFIFEGESIDANFNTVSATYPSEEAMIALAANNWKLDKSKLEETLQLMTTKNGAVTVILQGFVGISKKAIDAIIESNLTQGIDS